MATQARAIENQNNISLIKNISPYAPNSQSNLASLYNKSADKHTTDNKIPNQYIYSHHSNSKNINNGYKITAEILSHHAEIEKNKTCEKTKDKPNIPNQNYYSSIVKSMQSDNSASKLTKSRKHHKGNLSLTLNRVNTGGLIESSVERTVSSIKKMEKNSIELSEYNTLKSYGNNPAGYNNTVNHQKNNLIINKVKEETKVAKTVGKDNSNIEHCISVNSRIYKDTGHINMNQFDNNSSTKHNNCRSLKDNSSHSPLQNTRNRFENQSNSNNYQYDGNLDTNLGRDYKKNINPDLRNASPSCSMLIESLKSQIVRIKESKGLTDSVNINTHKIKENLEGITKTNTNNKIECTSVEKLQLTQLSKAQDRSHISNVNSKSITSVINKIHHSTSGNPPIKRNSNCNVSFKSDEKIIEEFISPVNTPQEKISYTSTSNSNKSIPSHEDFVKYDDIKSQTRSENQIEKIFSLKDKEKEVNINYINVVNTNLNFDKYKSVYDIASNRIPAVIPTTNSQSNIMQVIRHYKGYTNTNKQEQGEIILAKAVNQNYDKYPDELFYKDERYQRLNIQLENIKEEDSKCREENSNLKMTVEILRNYIQLQEIYFLKREREKLMPTNENNLQKIMSHKEEEYKAVLTQNKELKLSLLKVNYMIHKFENEESIRNISNQVRIYYITKFFKTYFSQILSENNFLRKVCESVFIENSSRNEKTNSELKEVKSLTLFDEELQKGKKTNKHKRQDTKILANLVSSGNRSIFENSVNSNFNFSSKNFTPTDEANLNRHSKRIPNKMNSSSDSYSPSQKNLTYNSEDNTSIHSKNSSIKLNEEKNSISYLSKNLSKVTPGRSNNKLKALCYIKKKNKVE